MAERLGEGPLSFYMPPILFARLVSRLAGWERMERRFPAQVWLEGRQQEVSAMGSFLL